MAEQRIQKVLADQGICSRREAERLIAAGKVKVNGHPVTLGDKMDPDYDKVMIDGQTQRIVRKRQYTYIMLHKPRGYLTTRSDDRGRKTVMDLVSDVPAMLRPVGRLDKDSEGLLLMTPFNPSATDDRTVKFVETYSSRYGTETLNQFAADGYDCIYAIYEAIQAAGVTPDMSHEEICEALIPQFTSSDFSVDGLTGKGMTWGTNGEVTKAPMVFRVENGAYVTVD